MLCNSKAGKVSTLTHALLLEVQTPRKKSPFKKDKKAGTEAKGTHPKVGNVFKEHRKNSRSKHRPLDFPPLHA